MPQLDITTYSTQIFWLLICFGILCFAVAGFLAPRLGKSISKRQKHMDDLHYESALLLKNAKDLRKSNQEQIKELHHQLGQQHRQVLDQINAEKSEALHQFDLAIMAKVRETQRILENECREITDQLPRIVTQVLQDASPQLFAETIPEDLIQKAAQRRRA